MPVDVLRRLLGARRRCLALLLLLSISACGTGVPDIDDAWRELRDPDIATDSSNADRRLLLARMVLEESSLPSGARARFPLGFAHLVEHLGAHAGSEALYPEFDRFARAITAGRTVSAEIGLDVTRVEAGSRVALEQLVEIRSSGSGTQRALWVPARPPGFPKPLAARDLRVEGSGAAEVWSRLDVEPLRLGSVGPDGFVASIPAGTERIRVIYGEGAGFWMPLRAGRYLLPLWVGSESELQFALGESVIEVIAAAPAEVQVLGPSVVRPGEMFELELRRTDRLGNEVGGSVRPATELWVDERIERRFPAGTGTRLVVGGLSRAERGVVRYRVESADGLVGWSAPILIREQGAKLQWGDPTAPFGRCTAEVSDLDFQRCVAWAGCGSAGLEGVDCDTSPGSGTLWMDRVRSGSTLGEVEDWRSGLGRYGVAEPGRGTLAFASLELLESGQVRTSSDWARPDVALLGTATRLGGSWPGDVVAAHGPLTALWSDSDGVLGGSTDLLRGYVTSGARMVIDCQAADAPTGSARCDVHGTAPLWRVDVLLPVDPTEATAEPSTTQTWHVVDEHRPLETKQRSLLVLTWSPRSTGARRPVYAEGELSISGGSIPAAALFGDPLESTALGRDGLLFRQFAPPTRGGVLVDVGGELAGDQRLRLVLRIDGWDGIVDFQAREVPFRRPLEAGWIETDWVAEQPVLDLDLRFPALDPSDVTRAVVLVQQVDGEIAVSRFRPNP